MTELDALAAVAFKFGSKATIIAVQLVCAVEAVLTSVADQTLGYAVTFSAVKVASGSSAFGFFFRGYESHQRKENNCSQT